MMNKPPKPDDIARIWRGYQSFLQLQKTVFTFFVAHSDTSFFVNYVKRVAILEKVFLQIFYDIQLNPKICKPLKHWSVSFN